MIPRLASSDFVSTAGAAKPLVPPLHFRGLTSPKNIRLHHVNYSRAQGVTAAQKNGLRYESQVQTSLFAKFADYNAGSYIHFEDLGEARTVQPDGLLVYPDYIFIFEIKYQHCPEAWWQLERLYKPLLTLAFPRRPVSVVEICRSYDPSMPFPCHVNRISDIVEWIAEPQERFGVCEWRRPL